MKHSEHPSNVLWDQKVLEHYRGYTIVTLLDRVDSDYSWIVKPGIFNAQDEFQDSDVEPQVGINCATREEAKQAAIDWISSQP